MRSIKSIHCVLLIALFALLLLPPSSHADNATLYGTATISSPASLGTIDLAFFLDLGSGGAIQKTTSYISLDKTLLFPVAPPKIGSIDVGPRVYGSITPTSFSLTSDDFTSVSKAIGDNVTRKIVLTGTTFTNGGNDIEGSYTETLLFPKGKNTIVVTGTFKLAKPVVLTAPGLVAPTGDGCINLAEIRAAGNDPDVIEFSDLSMAFDLKLTPLTLPNLCEPQDTVLQNALQEYYDTLQ